MSWTPAPFTEECVLNRRREEIDVETLGHLLSSLGRVKSAWRTQQMYLKDRFLSLGMEE